MSIPVVAASSLASPALLTADADAAGDPPRDVSGDITADLDRPRVRVRLVPIVVLVVFIAFAVALAKVADELADILGLVVFAAGLAWLLSPLRSLIARRIGGAASIIVIVTGMLVVGLGIGGLLVADLSSGADALSARVSASLATQSGRSWVAQLQDSLRLDDGVTQWLTSLPSRLVFGADGAPALSQRVIDMVVVVVLAAFFLASSGLVSGAVAAWPRRDREQVWLLLRDVDSWAGTFLRHSTAIGLLSGVVLGVIGSIAGVPVPVALGIWAGFWLTVPTVGWLVAVLPMAVTALYVDRVPLLIVLGATVLCAGAVRSWRRRHERPSFRLGIGVVVPCLAVGVAVSGSGVAILMLMLGTAVFAVLTSEHRHVPPPWAELDEDQVYRIGPFVWPIGMRGVIAGAVVVTVGVLARSIVIRSSGAVVWITVAALLAIAFDRPVSFLSRKLRMPRKLAVALTLTVVAAIAGALTLTIVDQGPSSTANALQELPGVVEDMQDAPVVGGWLTDHDAADVVRDQVEHLPGRIRDSRGALAWFPSVGAEVADVLWMLLLTIAFILDGGRLVAAVTRQVPARHRRQFVRLLGVSHQALAGYAAGAVLVSAMNGVVVLALALTLGIGLAPVLALWAFLWDFIPQVGGFIGGAPLLLFALIAGPGPLIIAGLVYLVYQVIESNVIFPAIIGESVDIPPWATMVAALVGAAAGGIVGAIVLTPLVGVIRSALIEYRRDDFPGRTAT